jgi:hypothetical protein
MFIFLRLGVTGFALFLALTFFFWAGYVEYIPGLLFLFLNFFLAIVFDTCVQLLKFQVTLSVHTISDAP